MRLNENVLHFSNWLFSFSPFQFPLNFLAGPSHPRHLYWRLNTWTCTSLLPTYPRHTFTEKQTEDWTFNTQYLHFSPTPLQLELEHSGRATVCRPAWSRRRSATSSDAWQSWTSCLYLFFLCFNWSLFCWFRFVVPIIIRFLFCLAFVFFTLQIICVFYFCVSSFGWFFLPSVILLCITVILPRLYCNILPSIFCNTTEYMYIYICVFMC